MSQSVVSHYDRNKQKHLQDLIELVRVPSVSFEGFPASAVKESAHATATLLKNRGLENVELLTVGDSHPYVYGDWLHAPGKPTLLLYAHHDVQPVGREYLWRSPPFEPAIIDGRLFGRGTADDKAGVIVHTAAIASYLELLGKLPLNVKLLVEGEEEIGSPHLSEFLSQYKNKLKADVIILTDTQNYDTGLPAITVTLRGLVSFDITVRSLKRSVHSGMLGGPAPDPAVALSKIFASLTDTEGRLAIPGIWDEVRPLTKEEEGQINSLPFNIPEFRNQCGFLADTKLLAARDGTSKPLIQMWREPSFAINAIEVSSRKQAANIINDSAWARFGLRIVPDMDPIRTARITEDYIRKITPWGCEVELKLESTAKAWGTNAKGRAFETALKALEKGYGRKPVLMGAGGTIPFVDPFESALGGVPVLLIGVEDPYTNAHSENESMSVDDFEKAIRSAIYFYEDFAG